MSKSDKTEKKSKGANKLILLLGAVALLGVGGAGAFAAMQMGVADAHAEVNNMPKLIRKGEADPYSPEGGEMASEVFGGGGSEYRTSYYSFADDFTSNLKESNALVQLSLAASTRRDGRVLLWLKQHELAIRSAILTQLANTSEDDMFSVEGKKALRKRLTDAINEELVEQEGFGGVDQVYFRTFIVQ
ncbi:flagellar basal body-associated FliL family protein [Croceicoccus gelatinilyticus]|uniref:flagellar basal body-associated FliL family protein n=1 Tax=Croceicoccus gelatinilyticus TaxID=2835536 RepID=UPI001BD026A4|nr:flagellar basal body-associated FliL family protein [Croceicoccus gelatinilyticus]MBS7671336.1 flagellar basal body-associated FliL family protein [Croceicoccus gelatinilyticus]